MRAAGFAAGCRRVRDDLSGDIEVVEDYVGDGYWLVIPHIGV